MFITDSKNVTAEIERIKLENPDLNYIDCCVEFCAQYNIEVDSLKKSLSKNLKEKIEADASRLRLLKYRINTIL